MLATTLRLWQRIKTDLLRDVVSNSTVVCSCFVSILSLYIIRFWRIKTCRIAPLVGWQSGPPGCVWWSWWRIRAWKAGKLAPAAEVESRCFGHPSLAQCETGPADEDQTSSAGQGWRLTATSSTQHTPRLLRDGGFHQLTSIKHYVLEQFTFF